MNQGHQKINLISCSDHKYVLALQSIDREMIAIAGGKGANLGDLSKIDGIRVPEGFCVTTKAYKKVTGNSQLFNSLLEELAHCRADERESIEEISAKIRMVIEDILIPEDIAEEIANCLARLGENDAYAVRSSATAEDSSTASFAGQQDTYLNVTGKEAILMHISRCWASLFTGRAVIYRIQNELGHHHVFLSVVVQKMVFPQASGILFTADPVTSNRKVLSIDAGFGLGEALVSGLVNADNYKVRSSEIIDKKVSAKKQAIYALRDGGTKEQAIEPWQHNMPALTDAQILQLAQIGKVIEEHFGCPQDIEWCLAADVFYIVQSRPITTLYPIPEINDQENHLYISVGHQQMMTDAMKPLGISLFQLTTLRPMFKAGGRLFVDVAQMLASPEGRNLLLNTLGHHDPLIKDALMTIMLRWNIAMPQQDDKNKPGQGENNKAARPALTQVQIENDPAIVADLINSNQASIEELKQNIQSKSGMDLLDFILEDIQLLKKTLLDPRSMAAIRGAMDATSWVNGKMREWLGEKNAADKLSQSVPNNITSEMGLALLDVADAIRPWLEVISYLQHAKDDSFLDDIGALQGGQEAQEAIRAFLDKYGMRCAGEIDITRPRWREKPAALIPIILNNIKKFRPGAGRQKFEQGLQEALKKEQELLERLRQLPDGAQKAFEAKRMISLIRNLSGYREYPKYGIVNRYFIYKEALLKEAQRLVQAGVIHEKNDIYYLTFEELREVTSSHQLDYHIIGERKDEHRHYEKLTPPRVMTSDGEIIAGKYTREHLPAGAIAGLAVSSGVVEGRARVILKMEDADIEDGDILITRYTDPSWTPLFVLIKGLVTEVGGLMTHGAVIAREYGLPAVVGVENATSLIKDGQRIRVSGTDGYIEVLRAGY